MKSLRVIYTILIGRNTHCISFNNMLSLSYLKIYVNMSSIENISIDVKIYIEGSLGVYAVI